VSAPLGRLRCLCVAASSLHTLWLSCLLSFACARFVFVWLACWSAIGTRLADGRPRRRSQCQHLNRLGRIKLVNCCARVLGRVRCRRCCCRCCRFAWWWQLFCACVACLRSLGLDKHGRRTSSPSDRALGSRESDRRQAATTSRRRSVSAARQRLQMERALNCSCVVVVFRSLAFALMCLLVLPLPAPLLIISNSTGSRQQNWQHSSAAPLSCKLGRPSLEWARARKSLSWKETRALCEPGGGERGRRHQGNALSQTLDDGELVERPSRRLAAYSAAAARRRRRRRRRAC
jgi:hypothetical protein